jgi:hypothetical protein
MPRDVAYGSCGGQIDCIATYLEAHMTNTLIRAEPRAAPQLGAMNSDKDNKAGFKQVDLTPAPRSQDNSAWRAPASTAP